ncbi:MAG: hypothetical protein ABI831_06205 [Betaproteobacteria bacterium]
MHQRRTHERYGRGDLSVNLAGHTSLNRVQMFAWKPAPVQVTWLGYLATTGVDAIDYLIADAWTLPESEEGQFTERIWRLPEGYICAALCPEQPHPVLGSWPPHIVLSTSPSLVGHRAPILFLDASRPGGACSVLSHLFQRS